MKKRIFLLIIVFFILQLCIPINNSMAETLDSNILLKTVGITITKTTKIDEITSKYGSSPKIVTPSAFGGNTYTYCKGDYENILFIETNSNGEIMSYGALSDDFKSSFYSSGDEVSNTIHYMQGTAATASLSDKAEGIVTYNSDLLTSQAIKNYCIEFMKDEHTYEKYYSMHAVYMLNYFLKKDGWSARGEFNEDLYDTISKITDNGKDISTYAKENNKEAYYKKAGNTSNYLTLWEELPNPLRPVKVTRNYVPTQDKKYAYLKYSMYINNEGKYDGEISSYYFDKNFIEKNDESTITLTAEEQSKYNKAKQVYKNSVNIFNQNGSSYYETEPTYKTTPLVAGKIKENKIQGAVEYLNAIRVAAGLSKISYDSELTESAQYKATLTSYMLTNGITTSNPHYPTKPSEVDQSFYDIAQRNMSFENLYSGNMITSITNAINDAYGDAISCGHRYNLLRPSAVKMGIGYTNGQGVHKLSGYTIYTASAVAWPSIGITPTEAYSGGYWTCKFYEDYTITSDTTVNVKCLNNNREWNFVETSTSGKNKFYMQNNQVSFYNADMIGMGEDGYVFVITIKNVKKDGNIVDYTYRSVFKSLSSETKIVYPTSINLSKSQIKGTIGAKFLLETTFSNNSPTEIRTIWSSSNTNVAKVNQYGVVTIVGNGTATITVKTLNGVSATCIVNGTNQISGLKIEKDIYIVRENKNEIIKVLETTGAGIDQSKIIWKIDNTSIAKIEGENIIGIKEGETKVSASYLGKTATANIKIIPSSNYSPSFRLRSELGYYDLLDSGATSTIMFTQEASESVYFDKMECNLYYDPTYIEVVKVEPILNGLTSQNISNGKIHFSYDVTAQNNIYKIEKNIAKITIKAKSETAYADNSFYINDITYHYYENSNIQYGSFQYPVSIKTANTIQKVTLSRTSIDFTVKGGTAKLTATITPSEHISSNKITWISSNTNIATVNDIGLVTAKNDGTAVITAKTVNGKTATCKITVKDRTAQTTIPITGIKLNTTNLTLSKGKTSTLVATITPSNTTQSKAITWTSSNSNIVAVNSSGVVTAKASGTATITAKTSNWKTATCTITVPIEKPTTTTIPITGIKLNTTNLTLNKGKTSTLFATITPSNTTQSKAITWTSSNSNIVAVNSSGVVTAKASGTATITAKTSNWKTATCTITVPIEKPTTTTIPITGIKLNTTNLTLNKGKTSTLFATITPSNTTQSKAITWTSSNSNIVAVNSSGVVTAKASGTATITAKTSNGKAATCTITVPVQQTTTPPQKKIPNVKYRTHVQDIGWQNYVQNGNTAGTTGRSLRLEGINIKLDNNEYGGGISYQTHVQNIGWQNYVQNDQMSGTSGKSLRLEAIRIKLTGEIEKYYDVYYRVHCQNFGWMGWAKNGEDAGSAGYSYRLEGIQIVLVPKGSAAPGSTSNSFIQKYVVYSTHVQNIGWQGAVNDGNMSGTSGRSLRLEAIQINLDNQRYSGDIEYRTHIQNIGWEKSYKKNGQTSGTSGKSLRLEAIQIRLTGIMATKYDVYYRVHCQNFGWMGWTKNGESAGSAGYSYRLEGIQIVLVPKGNAAPGSTSNAFKSK